MQAKHVGHAVMKYGLKKGHGTEKDLDGMVVLHLAVTLRGTLQ